MGHGSPGDGRLRKIRSELFGLFQTYGESVAQRTRDRLWREYQEVKRDTHYILRLLQDYLYHLTATSFVMVILGAVPASIALSGGWLQANPIGGVLSQVVGIHALFFGLTGVVAVGYVYAARFGLWLRRTVIDYWCTRTLPFPQEPDTDGESSARDIDEVPSEDWEPAKSISKSHIFYSFLLHFFGFWGSLSAEILIPGVEEQMMLDVLQILTQALAVLLGGLPALAGFVVTVPHFPLPQDYSGTALLILTMGTFIPALLLAVAVRNIAYRAEVVFHNLWSDTYITLKAIVILYLLWVVYIGMKQAFPSVLPW